MSTPASAALPAFPNAPGAVGDRVRAGLVPTWGPLAACFIRFPLAFAAHALTAAGMAFAGVPSPWEAAAPWMTVWATAVDLGTLALLAVLLRREGLRLRDLYRDASYRAVDLLSALGILLLLGAVGFAGGAIAGLVFYGTPTPPPPFGHLPLWAGLYSTLVWPVLWGVTEEATYNGYAAPRLTARFGRLAPALAIVASGWALQHVALPARLDLAHAGFRFFSSLPVALVAVPLYLKTGRLLPIALAHVWIDMLSGSLTLLPPAE